jgi:SAM-dependent methyltransferase
MSILSAPEQPAVQIPDRRLVFGQVAERYDRVRPGYPEDLIDVMFADAGLVPGDRALDIGTGTGQLARALAMRGLNVLAVDPSEEMLAVADRRFSAAGLDAHCLVSDFESAPLEAGAFSLITSGTSWHWLDPDVRFEVAAHAMRPGGTLAVLWNWPHWRRTALRAELDAVYMRSGAPLAEMSPMVPVEPDAGALAREWVRHTGASGFFHGPQGKLACWSLTYTAADYADLLGTYGDHLGLEPRIREPLLHGIRRVVDAAGGTIEVPHTTLLLTATRG